MLLAVDNDVPLPTDCAPLLIGCTVIGDKNPGGGPCIVAMLLFIPDANPRDDDFWDMDVDRDAYDASGVGGCIEEVELYFESDGGCLVCLFSFTLLVGIEVLASWDRTVTGAFLGTAASSSGDK